MKAERRCRTCDEVRPARDFASSLARRCTECADRLEAAARCECCAGPAGLKVNGQPRRFCIGEDCQVEQRRRARAQYRRTVRERNARRKTYVCSICTKRKPWTEDHFYVIARGEDAEPVRFDAYCKLCRRADTRARYHGDPRRNKRDRDRAKRQRERINRRRREDPEFDREYRKRVRILERARRQRNRDGVVLLRAEDEVDTGPGGLLPVAPLIEAVRARERVLIGEGETAVRERLAFEIGTTERQLWRWLENDEGDDVQLALADSSLIGLGLLWFDVWDPAEWPEAVRIFEPEDLRVAA